MLKAIFREIVLFGVCAFFTGAVGLIVVDTVVMPRLVRKGKQVEVPYVVDLTPAQARSRLGRRGLRIKVREPRWDATVAEGRIVAQHPPTSTYVKQDRTVYVVPSLGKRLYAVPDVKKKTRRQAGLWIEQAGLVVGEVTEEASLSVKEGLVIRQAPPAGTEVDAGTEVFVVTSTGPPRAFVAVPNLVEMRLEDARRLLDSRGLRSDDIRYEFSTAYDPNIVLRQEPEAGASAKRGSSVRLVVSKL